MARQGLLDAQATLVQDVADVLLARARAAQAALQAMMACGVDGREGVVAREEREGASVGERSCDEGIGDKRETEKESMRPTSKN